MRAFLIWFARWLLAKAERPAPAGDAVVLEAVKAACEHVGVPMAEFGPSLSLGHKAEQVLYHAAMRLDPDHRFETVQDVLEALR